MFNLMHWGDHDDPELEGQWDGSPPRGRRSYCTRPLPKTCNRCGETGLFWMKHDGRWRLSSLGIYPHVCGAIDLSGIT